MSGILDAEFWAWVGDFSRMHELSDYKLAKLIKQGRADIRKANSDKRLKQATQEFRKQTGNRLIEACVTEFVRRTDVKAMSLVFARKGSVIQFPRGRA